MGFMKFLCCLIPGRCDHDATDTGKRTPAASAATDAQPDAPEPRKSLRLLENLTSCPVAQAKVSGKGPYAPKPL